MSCFDKEREQGKEKNRERNAIRREKKEEL